MLSDRHDVARPGQLDEVHPLVGVELLTAEPVQQVLEPDSLLRPEGSGVMGVLLGARDVQVARVPVLTAIADGARDPVDEDAELRVQVPLGHLIVGERVPVGGQRPTVDDLSRRFEELGPVVIYLAGRHRCRKA